jgi:NADH:ubiquinone oxidoreductase subunit E
MDLHVIGPLASPAERAAVDAVLGPAATRWVGGDRTPGSEGHMSHGGHAARSQRDLLLPVLHAVQDRIGWISQPALNYVCKRLTIPPAEAYGVATFYALFATRPRPPVVAHVCDDIACRLAGAEQVCADLARTIGEAGAPAGDGRTTWLRSPCLGLCDLAPAALITTAGETPRNVTAAPVDAAGIVSRLSAGTVTERPSPALPQPAADRPRLLRRVGVVDPASDGDYREHGGYRGLVRALEIGPEAVIAEITASGLVGRGGAAFPTGRKWAAVAAQSAEPRYIVCNADESEPGTFKDRVLLEGDPYAVIEAMTIAGFAGYASYTWLSAIFSSAATTGVPPEGARLPGVPAASAYGEITWSYPAAAGLTAGLEVQYAGRMYVNDRNTDFAPAYTIGNLRIGFVQTTGRWTLREFARLNNITNENYVGTVIVGDVSTRYFEPAATRNTGNIEHPTLTAPPGVRA